MRNAIQRNHLKNINTKVMQKENKASEVILFKTAKHEFQDCSRIGSAPREESKAGG